MTEFKYCVHCENEPAVCFDTEADAMKFARECTDTCSCVKVEKSEIDEDGEILNNEVIWAADCSGDIEKESVSDSEFDMDFPASDIENIDISDDIDYDEIARQYKEDQADWIDDSKLIKEAVDALEENESEVECKCCLDIFPKESCIKTEKGYICNKCAQELHSHQGTNLDLIDSDPFSLDYEDPRDFDEPEEVEVKDEPVDANEVRKHEKAINEELKVIIDFSDYKPWSGAVDTYELIKDADKLDELEAYFEELYPDGITATQINDILWFDGEEVLKYLGLGDAEDEEIDESIKEHINDRPADIESDQEYQGVDNAVVGCKKYTVVAHSEDEKPVDCKLEKPALEEPLAGKKVDVKLNEAKKDDELPVDPEAAKLEVHTMLNDLVADEIEAINGYDDAKAQIMDTPIEHKDNILDTIDHIKGEEQEHIDELIGATTEIPFDKEETHDFAAEEESLAEETHAQYAKPEGDRVAAYNNALKYAKKENKPFIYGYTNHTGKFFAAETPMKVKGSPADAEKEFRSRYKNCNVLYVAYPDKDFIDEALTESKKLMRVADVEYEDDDGYNQRVLVYAGDLDEDALIDKLSYEFGFMDVYVNDIFEKEIDVQNPEVGDVVEVIESGGEEDLEIDEEVEEKSLTETKAKPKGDKVKSYNDGLKLAKLNSKPVIYGYTNSSYGNKFFALNDPIVCDNVSDETKKFKRQYKSCNVVYVAYPDDQFIEK